MSRRGHRPHHTGVLEQSAAGWQGMQAGIMQGSDLHVGRTYAYRQTARRDDLELMKAKNSGPGPSDPVRRRTLSSCISTVFARCESASGGPVSAQESAQVSGTRQPKETFEP